MFNKNIEEWTNLGANYTATEIAQQPETWLKTFDIVSNLKTELNEFIADILAADNHDIILTGAGTSEFVGNTIAPVLQQGHKYNVRSIATTDLVVTPELYFNKEKPTLLISYGRSGNSPESVAAVALADQIHPNVKHLIITCNHEGNLALREEANIFAIKLPKETNDKSFAMTSSYSNMYLATYLTFHLDTLDDIKPQLEEIAKVGTEFNTTDYKVVEDMVNNFDFKRIVYLGDAHHNGLAQESSLKVLELTAGEVIPTFNTPLGFRHGPKSIINGETLLIVYMQNNPYVRKYQFDLVKEVSAQREQGMHLMVIDTQEDPNFNELVDNYVTIKYNKPMDLGLEVLNMIMYGQTFSLLKSIHTGKQPDNPWPSGMVNRVVKGVVIYPYKED